MDAKPLALLALLGCHGPSQPEQHTYLRDAFKAWHDNPGQMLVTTSVEQDGSPSPGFTLLLMEPEEQPWCGPSDAMPIVWLYFDADGSLAQWVASTPHGWETLK